jgi:SAM-dependent methyltransferase
MAESVIFILIIGIALISIVYVFHITWISPIFFIIVLTILILPGMFAAFTTGPFVPSARKKHKIMIGLANLKSGDTVYDLGCGDGRLVFNAAPKVKKAIGYELSIPLVLYGKFISLFVKGGPKIKFGNIWKQKYEDADVIFCYLLPGAMQKFHKVIWPTLKPGTRVISNSFQIRDLKPAKEEDRVYLYIA